MFAFAFDRNGMTFVRVSDHIFTYPHADRAKADFKGVRSYAHLYRIDVDLGMARIEERGEAEGPDEFEPTEKQKRLLFQSYVYKSLLEWVPNAEENVSQV